MKDSQQAAHTGIEKSHKQGHAFISFHQSIHDVTANIQLVKVDVQAVEEKYKVYTRYRQAGARYSMNTTVPPLFSESGAFFMSRKAINFYRSKIPNKILL